MGISFIIMGLLFKLILHKIDKFREATYAGMIYLLAGYITSPWADVFGIPGVVVCGLIFLIVSAVFFYQSRCDVKQKLQP